MDRVLPLLQARMDIYPQVKEILQNTNLVLNVTNCDVRYLVNVHRLTWKIGFNLFLQVL